MREADQTFLPTSNSAGDCEMQLSLCMIVRDNANTLRPALESIRPFVDEMIVVDTGSVDETPEIARSLGAKVFHFPWCDDFARARNESLKHASGRWLFWMDSDDTIPESCGQRLRELSRRPLNESPLAYVMQVHCPGPGEEGNTDVTIVDHVKLFQNVPELRFEGRIHEQVLSSIHKLSGQVQFTDIYVVHSGSDHSQSGRKRKLERDLRLIRLELEEQPDHPFHLFNLGMTLAYEDRHAEAIEALRHMLSVAQPHESPVRKSYALLVKSLTELKQFVTALETADAGLAFYPQNTELHFRRALALHHLERRPEAIAAYRFALTAREERHYASVDRGIGGFKARHNMAVICTELQEHNQAELQWRLALEEVPAYRAGWRGLFESLVAQRKLVTCDVELRRMKAIAVADSNHRLLLMDERLLRFELAKAQGQLDTAGDVLSGLQADFPHHPNVLRSACQFFFEKQDFMAAEKSLETLTQIAPEDGAAWHNLGAVQAQFRRFDEAEKALRNSLRIRPNAAHTQLQLEQVLQARTQEYLPQN